MVGNSIASGQDVGLSQELIMPRLELTESLPSRCSATARGHLSQEEERRLARLAAQGDERAFERLVQSHLPLVHAIASEFRSYGLPADELVSEGLLGLVKAARCFDPERGVPLAGYAAWWIRAYIRTFTLENRRIVRGPCTRGARKILAGLNRTERTLTQLDGERPQPEALARALGVSVREVDEMRAVLRARDVPCGVETNGRVFELPSDAPSPETVVSEAEERELQDRRLRLALSQLDPRARRVLEQRNLLPEVATLGMLGNELGVSKERVRQIEVQAKARVQELCA
jgi:RNA polymerase sigma-32 factor